jgi:hypothetical protein
MAPDAAVIVAVEIGDETRSRCVERLVVEEQRAERLLGLDRVRRFQRDELRIRDVRALCCAASVLTSRRASEAGSGFRFDKSKRALRTLWRRAAENAPSGATDPAVVDSL